MIDASLEAIFEREGAIRQVSGNSPVFLEGRDSVWMVLSGQVDVFWVDAKGEPSGVPKKYLFSVPGGRLLFGMDPAPDVEQALQAVGLPGTRLAGLNLDRLTDLSPEQPAYRQLATGIDAWVRGLSEGLTRDIVPAPLPDRMLGPNKELDVAGDIVLSPAGAVAWIRFQKGGSYFLGMEEISADTLDGVFPLSEKSWIVNSGSTVLATTGTEEVLAAGIVRQGLAAFHERALQVLQLNSRLEAVDRYNFLKEKIAVNRAVLQTGLARLACTLEKTPPHISGKTFADPILSACALVCERLGVPTREPPGAKRLDEARTFTVQDVARLWRVHLRRITLRGAWWKRDSGPLVAFRNDRNRPVALLPLSHKRYEIVDPTDGSVAAVTRKEAETLSPIAYTFYRRLPERAISGMDLFKHGLRGCGRDLWRVALLGAVIGLLSLIIPLATGMIFNDIIPGAEKPRLLQLAVIIACFGLTALLFEAARNVALLRVESRMAYSLEAAVWDRVIRLPIPFFRRFAAGNLALRGMSISLLRQRISGVIITGMIGSLFSGFNYLLLFYYSAPLALLATVPILLFVAVLVSTTAVALKFFRKSAAVEGKISGYVLQFLAAVTKLRVAGAEDKVFSIWAADFSTQKKMAFKGGLAGNVLSTLCGVFPLLACIPVFLWLGSPGKGASMTTGDFLAFNAAYSNLQLALIQIAITLNMAILAVPLLERMRPILESVPEVDPVKKDPGELTGKVELYNVYFRYNRDGQFILKNVSLRIEPGEFVAVVGPSGSGKSTLIRLLLGFEKPETGTLYFDDQDLADLDVAGVRSNMGVVLQNSNLMPGDVFTNIVGSHPLSLDDAWEAARMAGLDQDIKDMPMGMHTVIMEGATTLSAGQRQRLMIARAVADRPRILIFDEATSALDNRTQAIVSESLKNLKATRIVIAHRLSTVMEADRIYVLSEGEIVESGVYSELISRGGLFEKLARRQMV